MIFDEKEFYVISATIFVAITGYIFTYISQRKRDKTLARLSRVNSQLKHFYGPLFSLLHANNSSWVAFSKNYWPSHSKENYFDEKEKLTSDEKRTWKLWVEIVFLPMNEEMVNIIIHNTDLIEADDFPQVFSDLITHVNSYKVIKKKWGLNADNEMYSPINSFPREALSMEIDPIFHMLKAEQTFLLGALSQNQSTYIKKIRSFKMEKNIAKRS